MTSNNPVIGKAPPQVRLAGVLTAAEGLVGLGTAAAYAVRSIGAENAGDLIGGAAYFSIIGAALVAVGAGLVTGRRWARTPAIVTQLLLLPVIYSLLGPSHQLVLGIAAGAVVVAAFLLLISEPSRLWSMGLDHPGGPDGPRR